MFAYAGIIDNIYGANFNTNPPSADVNDQHGHGTHVAGIIGAVGNDALGIAGINQVHQQPFCSRREDRASQLLH